jgi:hypothetical protein
MTQPSSTPSEPPSVGASHDQAYNRDDELKPGDKARMAQEPAGSEGSSQSPKTATDPASGEPTPGKAPNRAEADQSDSAGGSAPR